MSFFTALFDFKLFQLRQGLFFELFQKIFIGHAGDEIDDFLVIGIIIMVASVGTIGWWLSGIAIEPVRQSYASLKQFTADASHELRNPIATIQTNVQMALAYPEAEPQQQIKQLQIIERLTQRLGKLVNDLLFLARSD